VPPLSLSCSHCGGLWLSPHEWCGPCRAAALRERILLLVESDFTAPSMPVEGPKIQPTNTSSIPYRLPDVLP
jgi:hypothetical protein